MINSDRFLFFYGRIIKFNCSHLDWIPFCRSVLRYYGILKDGNVMLPCSEEDKKRLLSILEDWSNNMYD